MNKKVIGFALGAALALSPLAALAASVPANAVFNGQTQVWGNPGQTVQVTLRVNANAGEVVHAIRTDVLGDSAATVCQDISNFEGAQNKDVTLSIILPPNTGDYGFEAVVYSATNVSQANALSGDAACATSAGNTAGPTFNGSGGNIIHVIPSGSTSGSGGAPSGIPQSIWDKFIAWMSSGSSTPAVSAVCAAYAQANAGTQANVYNDANVRLQGFLLSQGASIPALKAGASFGFRGPQTEAAVSWFQSLNHCN